MGKTPKKKRKPSAYNRHIGREMKAGKTMKQAAASWKSKGSKKSSPRKRSSKSTTRRSNTTMAKRRNGFNTRKLFSGVRMVSLLAPAAITIVGPETPKRKAEIVVAKYTGVGPDGKFRLNDLRQGYEPYFWTSLATYGIPKVVNFVKGLFG